MRITIFPPVAISETGGRQNNEDAVYPLPGLASVSDRLFLVCDGMGGLSEGEQASSLTISAIRSFFAQHPGPATFPLVSMAVQEAEKALEAYLQTLSAPGKMGTTLTLLHLHRNGATVAHVGDSRIYHCRGNNILYRSTDHKLVDEWVKEGILTPEQAMDHPQRNVITRAIQGRPKTPALAEVSMLTDLRPGDYFFLCSDGILEQLTDAALTGILSEQVSDEVKMHTIKAVCEGRTADNYSAYLIHLQAVDADESPLLTTDSPAVVNPLPGQASGSGVAPTTVLAGQPARNKPAGMWLNRFVWLAGMVIACILTWQISSWFRDRKHPVIKPFRPPQTVPVPNRPTKSN
nr:PP2C family serine/threonine-protein phosphatase [uncultured Arsenicibacter sp.]